MSISIIRSLLFFFSITVVLVSCKSESSVINVMELKRLVPKVVLDGYSNKLYSIGNYSSVYPYYTILKKGKPDTVLGINLNTGLVIKVSVVDVLTDPILALNNNGAFSFVDDSLIMFVSSLSDYGLNKNHNKILRIYNLNSKQTSFFNFDGLPVITENTVLGKFKSKNGLLGSELAYYPWTFQYNPMDSSVYVMLAKTLTAEKELTYNESDKVWMAKVYLNAAKSRKYKTIFPRFHYLGDSKHRPTTRPNSSYYSNKFLIGYPAHLDIYQFDKDSKETRLIPVSSSLVPNELRFTDSDSISAHNTGFIGILKNQNGNGYFRVAQTKSKSLIGTEFKNYLDFRSILIWKKDNGEVAECYLDKPIWSVAYANNDTLYCTSKITNETKQLTLEKYLITGTKKVNKQKYLNEVLGFKP